VVELYDDHGDGDDKIDKQAPTCKKRKRKTKIL
jgi:hypothetical protein